jgi:hypothetical protein
VTQPLGGSFYLPSGVRMGRRPAATRASVWLHFASVGVVVDSPSCRTRRPRRGADWTAAWGGAVAVTPSDLARVQASVPISVSAAKHATDCQCTARRSL